MTKSKKCVFPSQAQKTIRRNHVETAQRMYRPASSWMFALKSPSFNISRDQIPTTLVCRPAGPSRLQVNSLITFAAWGNINVVPASLQISTFSRGPQMPIFGPLTIFMAWETAGSKGKSELNWAAALWKALRNSRPSLRLIKGLWPRLPRQR